MKRQVPYIIYIVTLLAVHAWTPAKAWAGDSLRISLLTCGPGEEIYTLFGHTAIRCENLTKGTDVVYNYGLFDFDAPNFVLRFALGKTDYQLGRTDFRRFAFEYQYYNRWVKQQTLNLTMEEKLRLMELLQANYRPENRVYRYNFFYDNCATRLRDKIEAALNDTLLYADDMATRETGISFRDLLHRYSQGHPWSRFGMDLCMGPKADEPITRREMMFVPFLLQHYLNEAQTADSIGRMRPLLLETQEVITTDAVRKVPVSKELTPFQAALMLFIAVASATVYGVRRGKSLWVLDLGLFAAAGIAGCILAFLACLSQHPAVSPNYLLFVFHPLHLLLLPWFIRKVKQGKPSLYMRFNVVVLTLFILLGGIIPQEFPLTILPLTLCLLMRSAGNVILTYKRKK